MAPPAMLAAAIFTTACGGALPIVGAAPSPGPPSSPSAVYSLVGCVDANANPTNRFAGNLKYYLDQRAGGLALHEFDAAGKGAMITNHWRDEWGDHFFTYVQGSYGLEIVLPEDRVLSGVRHIYDKLTYGAATVGDAIRVEGTPIVTCVVEPERRPSSASGGPVAPVAVPAGCQTDTECGGDLVCEGGTCVSVLEAAAEPDAGAEPEPAPLPAPALEVVPEPEKEGTGKKKGKSKKKGKGKQGQGRDCGADTDCPGDEVCEDGKCAAPPRPEPESKPAGCAHDLDCKGNRICELGKCVTP